MLLTGGRAPACLHLARLFAESGYNVFVADSITPQLCRYSRFVQKTFTVRKPKTHPMAFLSDINDIIQNENISLLVPTCEEVFYLSMVKEKLDNRCEVFVMDIETLDKLHNKAVFIQCAKEMGLQVPDTRVVTEMRVFDDVLRKEGGTFALKPVYSRFSSTVYRVSEKEKTTCPSFHPTKQTPWVMQRWVEGEQYCTYSVVREGKLLAHSCYRTVYTAGGGAAIVFSHLEEERITEWVRTFVEAIHFHGQIAFDFIVTKDDEVFPIECNPRATSGVHLFDASDKLHLALTGDSVSMVTPKPNQSRMITLAVLLYGWRKGRLSTWFKTLRDSSDVLFHKRDSAPFFYQLVTYGFFIKVSLKKRCSVIEATTHDINWNGERL